MTVPKNNRYSTQSIKKKEFINDPYSMKQAPKGLLECPECHAVFYRKRWSFPDAPTSQIRKPTAVGQKKPTKQILVPQSFVCPACRKLQDGYAEGFLTIHWPHWETHKAEILGLIHNEEHQAVRNNPLERVMTIRTRPDGADIETTTEHFAQRLGKHLDRAFKGSIEYRWSHKDKCVRVTWQGPTSPKKRARSAKVSTKKS
ncbi:MAG: BCAM0308 family protein [Nitrospirota bacterium]|nr:BCAM0308 family protein [Nitrospirota bacterium]MDH5585677.1 BCAM0308 family protein [Nitrospirota bacterium]MDH5773799.1 BCAM0308 family protein [Nitrospirota bacterium]